MSKIAHQKNLERLYSNSQTITRIRKEFMECTSPNFAEMFKQKGISQEFGFTVLVQMALHKRCDLATLVGLTAYHFDTLQECADEIYQAALADLMDYDPRLDVFIVRYGISDDVQREIDLFQYPLPLVVEPKEVKNNSESGYYTNNSSVILKDNHHEMDVCLDHINRVNKVKMCVNVQTVQLVKNEWRNLDKAKQGESREDFQKRKRAFDKYDKCSKEVLALMTQEGNEFYFDHKYDARGRFYCQGYHANYQGTAWNKAVLEFADKEPLN